MSDFFDSSVIVAAIYSGCPEHEACAKVWAASAERVVYTHALLETYSQLTGGRLGVAVAPDLAADVIRRNTRDSRARMISFDSEEMLDRLSEAHQFGVRGGAVYDYLHLCAARKSASSRIYTLNRRHFVAIAPDLAASIIDPTKPR